jgi:hypothetical protein
LGQTSPNPKNLKKNLTFRFFSGIYSAVNRNLNLALLLNALLLRRVAVEV